MKISEDLRQALAENSLPLEVTDEHADRRYYVISEEQYRRMQALFELEPIDPSFYEAGEIHLYEQ
jgi:hypothetical protein